eukprot:3880334-Amphidinium_carterae.2
MSLCSQDHKFLTSIANELRVLRRVRHPHIVSFFGACVDASYALSTCWAMQVKSGQSLDKYVRSWKSAPSTECRHKVSLHQVRSFTASSLSTAFAVLKVLLDVSCALRYLHAQAPAVVHGDLKPSNVLVEDWCCSRVLCGCIESPLLSQEGRLEPHAKLLDFGLSRVLGTRPRPLGGTEGALGAQFLLSCS